MRKGIFILYFLISFQGISLALYQHNAPSDSLKAEELYTKAKDLFVNSNFTRADETAAEAFQVASAGGYEKTELQILLLRAEIQKSTSKLEDAIFYHLQAIPFYESAKDTSGLVNIYSEIAGSYFRLQVYEKAGEYYHRAFNILPAQYETEQAVYLENIGFCALYGDQPDSAVRVFVHLKEVLQKQGKEDTKAIYYLVRASNNSGKYQEALNYNNQLFDRFRSKNDYVRMSSVKNNIAYNFTLLGRYQEAIPAYKDAIEYAVKAKISDQEQGKLITNTGICFQNTGERREAMRYFREAINKFKSAGDFIEKGRVENILAKIYYQQGDLYNAGLFSRQAIESLQQSGDAQLYAESCLTYSRILRDGNDPITALEYYEKYLNLSDSLQLEGIKEEEKKTGLRLQLEKSEKELSLKTKAEELRKLSFRQLSLQLEKEEREKELLLREAEVERLEKDRLRQEIEIARQQNLADNQEKAQRLLEWENQMKDARLQQDSLKSLGQEREIKTLETQKELARLNLERQEATKKLMTWIIVLVLLGAISILGGLISSRRKNMLLARQKKEIQEQNADLEQKNDEISAQRDEIESQRDLLMDQKEQIEHIHLEITQSIEYAKKIQTSTLPDPEVLNTVAKESFVFFRPRDIVSGDFYWFANVDNTLVVTAADCTGHGVPGAFMSMLGMSLLKETVLKEYITQPSVILRRLRKEIINALGQKGVQGEQKDGMDISLVSIYPAEHKIEYAGAFNPLYIIREKNKPAITGEAITSIESETHVLYIIHADKMPIALYERMDKFTTHEIASEDGDLIYLFTDGFADQFGGPSGKKFMYKPFMKLLLDIADKPLEKQNEILAHTFTSWKGNLEQVDDICVIGLKI